MRLESGFFKAYNEEIDNLRRRRGENAQAFQAFVNLKQERGEKVTVEELERLRAGLANGDMYFGAVLPQGAELNEIKRRTDASAAAKVASEYSTVLANRNTELQQVNSLVGQFVDQDITTEEGRKTVREQFERMGMGALFERYSPMLGSMQQNARFQQLQNAKDTIGFDNIRSEEELGIQIATLPAWMREPLRVQWGQADDVRVRASHQAAITQLNLSEMATTARGDRPTMITQATNRYRILHGQEPTQEARIEIEQLVDGAIGMYNSGVTTQALAGFVNTIPEADLIEMVSNPERAREVTRQALLAQGMPASAITPAILTQAMAQANQAANTKFTQNIRYQIAPTMREAVNNMTYEELKLIDSDLELDQQVEAIMANSLIPYATWPVTEQNRVRAEIRASLRRRVDLANEREGNEAEVALDTEVFGQNSPILRRMNLASVGSPGEGGRKEMAFREYNLLRERRGLQAMSQADFDTKIWPRLENASYDASAQRYENSIAAITQQVSSIVETTLNGQQEALEGMMANATPQAVALARNLSARYMIPEELRAQATEIIALMAGDTTFDPNNQQALNATSALIAQRLRLVSRADAPRRLRAELLAEADLIQPGTNATRFWSEHTQATLATEAAAYAATIASIPSDRPEDAAAKVEEYRQWAQRWRDAMYEDVQDTKYITLLSGHNPVAIQQMIEAQLAQALESVTNAQPLGNPSYFSQAQNGYFVVMSSSGPDAERARAAGIIPNRYYQKIVDANGTRFELVNQVIPDATGGTTSGTGPRRYGMGYDNVIDPATNAPIFQQINITTDRPEDISRANAENHERMLTVTAQIMRDFMQALPDNHNPTKGGLFGNGRGIAGWADPSNEAVRRSVQELRNWTRIQNPGGAATVQAMGSDATDYFTRNPGQLLEFRADPLGWWMANGASVQR